MLEESLPVVIWSTMNSWFTPTTLFIFLNLMIGIIAISSGIGNQSKSQQQQQNQLNDEEQKRIHPQLVRSPSTLQRLKSFNFYKFSSEDQNPFPLITTTILNPPPEPETHKVQHLQVPVLTTKQVGEETLDDNYDHNHVTRTKSDTIPASGDIPVKLSKKMRKSASTKSAFAHFEEEEEEEEIVQIRPSTVKEGKKKSNELQSFGGGGGDDELAVDAKADDFINKFKQQLKLQRLDSILRYKEMLKRG